MTELIITVTGPIKRIVRSRRTFQDVPVGAIHDKGYLVMVRQMGESTAWFPIHVIRKLSR